MRRGWFSCIGCCEANPNDPGDNWVEVNTPFYKRHRDLRIGDWVVQPEAIALTLTGIVAACLVVHGFGMKASGRLDGKVRFEEKRAWDAKHPENSIGQYDTEKTIIDENGNETKMSAADFEKKQEADFEKAVGKKSEKGGQE